MPVTDDDDDMDDDKPASPRPWSVNEAYFAAGGCGKMPSPILDANGREVFDVSEWVSVRRADIALIVAAVNERAT